MPNTRLICMGKITSAHGIQGAVKVQSYTEDPLSILDYNPLWNHSCSRSFALKKLSMNKEMLIVKIEGVTDRNEAEKLRGTELYAPRDALPEVDEEEFYHEDLIGLEVRLESGEVFGKVASIQNYGAGDVVIVHEANSRKEACFSFTKAIFPEIHLSEGYLVLCPPETEDLNDDIKSDKNTNGKEP